MCGISGIYHPGESPERWDKTLQAMTRGLIHRGPDEDGFYQAPGVSLGMRRLKVIDLITGTQPIANEDETIQIVFNGEIYRYEALRKNLQALGHTFKTTSDTEVLVHLYEQYGLNFFEHFDGMFAFALWDSRSQRLVVARDRFGIKPLFYTIPKPNGYFAFASELRPLLRIPGLSKALDSVAINQFFTLSYILHPRSVYQQIRKLSPGSYLLVEGETVQERCYWDLPSEVEPSDPDVASVELDAALSSAVGAMMRSDVPVGAFLSGGLDSSTVVYHMTHHSQRPVQTFSVRFAERSFDEGDQSRLIARHLGTEHHEIFARPKDVYNLPAMVDHFGEPFADPSQIPTYLVSKLAREQVTVSLSGDGGDELLGGYETYSASQLASVVGCLPETLRRSLLWLTHRMPVSLEHHLSFDYKMRKFLMGCHLPPLEHHTAWRTVFSPLHKQKLYAPEFAQSLGNAVDKPVFEQWAHLFKKNGTDRLTQYQYLDTKTYLIDNNLTKVDRMSMAHSLEVRVPFLDLRVATAAFRLPPRQRVRFFRTKVSLRKMMRGRLPESVLRMPKKGFAVPLGLWFLGPLQDFLDESLRPDRITRTRVLRSQPVGELVEAHRRRRGNFSRQIWNVLCFMRWYEDSEAKGFL